MNLGYGSHQPVLSYVLDKIDKPVLELGSGMYSTQLIHEQVKDKGIEIVTVDHDRGWLKKYEPLKSSKHKLVFCRVAHAKDFYKANIKPWGLVFVDIGDWTSRGYAVLTLKNSTDYMIIHDCDYFPGNNSPRRRLFGKVNEDGTRDYSDVFKYWIEFFPVSGKNGTPPTLLGSNTIDLRNVQINEMKILSTNESN